MKTFIRSETGALHSQWYVDAMEHFVDVVQDLSYARSLNEVMAIVRRAARELTGADGATFILRDGDLCYYAEENAISPLWKGQRFPMARCISGWVMTHGQTAFIPDIYADARIPAEAYRPTFVKSLVMVPIRHDSPLGAIGNYWASNRVPAPEEIKILESLANVTAVAMENVELYHELQKKIRALEISNEELNRFAWIASHDLKSPLRSIDHLSDWIEEDAGIQMNPDSRQHVLTLRQRVRRMERLLDDILSYAQLERKLDPANAEIVDGRELVENAVALLDVPAGFTVDIGAHMPDRLPRMPLKLVFTNLIGNAIKHHNRDHGRIWVEAAENESHYVFAVRDDGPGIAPEHHEKIFEMFQTLGPKKPDQESNGMGLAFVRKILDVNGGTIQVESAGPNAAPGTVFHFTWPKSMTGQINDWSDLK